MVKTQILVSLFPHGTSIAKVWQAETAWGGVTITSSMGISGS